CKARCVSRFQCGCIATSPPQLEQNLKDDIVHLGEMVEKKELLLERESERIPGAYIARQERAGLTLIQKKPKKQPPLRDLVAAADQVNVAAPIENLVRRWRGYRE